MISHRVSSDCLQGSLSTPAPAKLDTLLRHATLALGQVCRAPVAGSEAVLRFATGQDAPEAVNFLPAARAARRNLLARASWRSEKWSDDRTCESGRG